MVEDEKHIGFPLHATISGVAVVTIPLTDYADLLEKRARLVKLGKADRYPVPPRSPIEVDTQVKAFFLEHLGKKRMPDLLQECRRNFGASRTPSKTAAYRFWQRLRQSARSLP